jgi:ubiquitin carboxyl-terminal hydrolase L5
VIFSEELDVNGRPGEYGGDWTVVARPFIEQRMLQYESDQVSFNLLALCRNPLGSTRRLLAESIRCQDILGASMKTKGMKCTPAWLDADGPDARCDKLSQYGLTNLDVEAATSQQEKVLLDRIASPTANVWQAQALRQELEEQQQLLRDEYAATVASMNDDAGAATGRQKDYTSAVHDWAKKLIDHRVLQALKRTS